MEKVYVDQVDASHHLKQFSGEMTSFAAILLLQRGLRAVVQQAK